MLRYLGSPVQPSLDNINSGGLFWSSVITSGHWERERAGSNTIQHLHCPPAPLISTYNINLNHQPRTYPPHHAIDQHRTDITDIADTLKAKECPFVIVYIMYYIMYSILLIVRISQKLNLLGSEDLKFMELLFLSSLHFYINQFLLFLISWCLRFHYISVLWSITATKNYKITNKIKIYFQKTKGFIKLSFNVIQFQSFVNSATETESLARIVSF